MTLRRTGPPERKTPLVSRSELPRTRIRTHAEFRAHRPVITPAERHARDAVTARAQGRCEGCGRHGQTEWSHRIARGRGGIWCPSNGIALCGSLAAVLSGGGDNTCHHFCHDQPAMARSVGWIVRTNADPSTVPALLHGRGWTLLTADGLYVPAPEPTERTA